MNIVNVPIEPLDERYSAQWCKWFEEALKDIKHVTVQPSSKTTIQEGAFLDIVGTVSFKSRQIAMICEMLDSGLISRIEKTVFIIQDGWFPIEQLAYIRDLLGCHQWKFIGIFHDGTYDKWDLLARKHCYIWGNDLERSWFKIYDRIVVGSHYHADVLDEERGIRMNKVSVIPWPVFVPPISTLMPKENIVVFPHRLDVEKQPELFGQIKVDFYKFNPHTDWQFIRTRDQGLNKVEYQDLLARSTVAISTALLEMFGISMVEATLLGCIPLVPDRLSYKEMFYEAFRYDDIADLHSKLSRMARFPNDYAYAVQNQATMFRNNSKQFFPKLLKLAKEI